MTSTGKCVSKERLAEIEKIFERTREPLFGVTTRDAFRTAERIDRAQAELREAIDRAAVELGFPEPEKNADGDVIHYGLLGTGEIVTE
jgi:hypothetical protein